MGRKTHSIYHSAGAGKPQYRDEGILDRTHLRFFTLEGLLEMIDAAGLKKIDLKDIRQN